MVQFHARHIVKLPSPEDVRINDPRICTRENRAINWDLVDVFLRAVKDSGSLALLGRSLAISRDALSKRRKELRMAPLPTGRHLTVKYTAKEAELVQLIKRGDRPSTIAAMTGVARQTVESCAKRITQKDALRSEYGCTGPDGCGGFGVVSCKSCDGIGPHYHTCLKCGGQSTTWASQEQ